MNMDTSHIDKFIQWLGEHGGENMEYLKKPHIKSSLEGVYHVFIGLYILVGLLGLCGSIATMATIIRKKLYTDPSFVFLFNIAVYGLLTSLFVLPLTLTEKLLENWIFGNLICFLHPMLQTFPIYCTMICYVVLVVDRYLRSSLGYQVFKKKATTVCVSIVVVMFIWILGVGLVAPFVFHMQYIDLGSVLEKSLEGVGWCSEQTESEQVRKLHLISLSLVFCFCPTITLCMSVMLRVKLQKKVARDNIGLCQFKDDTYGYDGVPQYYSATYGKDSDEEDGEKQQINLAYELKLLKYINAMIVLFTICWIPQTLLTVSHQFDHKLEGGIVDGIPSARVDIIHLSLMLVGFVCTCTTPLIFGLWVTSVNKDTTENSTSSETGNEVTPC